MRRLSHITANSIHDMTYSVLIPVYNRPDEVRELLESLAGQRFTDFEVIVVDDGSTRPCADVVRAYAGRLDVRYFAKPNSGPGPTRNYAAARAQGTYLLILDSDVVLPPDYLQHIQEELQQAPCDAFGGPDRAHPDFTPVQKAINYAMTSFLPPAAYAAASTSSTSFIPARSIWACGAMCSAPWAGFPTCVLARTLI